MLSRRLKFLRKKNNLTQQQVAEHLNVTLRQYQRYEVARCEPPLNTLVVIADFFDVSIDYLLCRDEWISSHVTFVDV